MILIAVGANLGTEPGRSPLETCKDAVARLTDLAPWSLKAISGWYRTRPEPASSQPDYCNGVVRFEGAVEPAGLLAALHELEAEFGRVRSTPNAARTLDLDIIDINGIVRATPSPILPHPRAHLRAFVLRPLMDVAPGWRHPTLRQSVASLMAVLPLQSVVPWEERATVPD